MKFSITDDYHFWWPVTVRVPSAQRPGEIEEQSFEARFRALTSDEATKLDAKITESDDRQGAEQMLLREVVVDWRGVEDEAGASIGFATGLDIALSVSWIRAGLYRAYAQAMAGDAARLGN